MASKSDVATKPICQFKRADGGLCKRYVRPPEKKCWQHASSFRHQWKSLTRNQTILFLLAALAVPSFIIGIVALIQSPTVKYVPQPPASSANQATTTIPLSLHDLFKTEFSNDLKVTMSSVLNTFGWSQPIEEQLYFDPAPKSLFVGYYIPDSPHFIETCRLLANRPPETIAYLDKQIKVQGGAVPDEVMTDMKSTAFTGRVYIYHESTIRIQDKAKLMDLYERKKLDLILRGPDYWAAYVASRDKTH